MGFHTGGCPSTPVSGIGSSLGLPWLTSISACAIVSLAQTGLSSYDRLQPDEVEAADPAGQQKAATLWARGANSFVGKTRVSPVGDAYELASSFGSDVSELLVKGPNRFRTKLPSIPTMQRVKSLSGGVSKSPAGDAFGRVGLTELLVGSLVLASGWTDIGPQADQQTHTENIPSIG